MPSPTPRQANWPSGYQLNPSEDAFPAEWLEKFQDVPASWISDNLGRSIGTTGVRIYHQDIKLIAVGRALTVRVRPGDNLMIHKALEIARKGDFLVVDGGGDVTQALMGGNMQITAIQKGIAGILLNGAVRDLSDWADNRMPIWAVGHTHRGPSKDGPGEVNVPVSCAGLYVNPGDLVLGDADGVVAVPGDDLSWLWPKIEKQVAKEKHLKTVNSAGTADPERFNAILREKGCPV
jgi:RraA family protein